MLDGGRVAVHRLRTLHEASRLPVQDQEEPAALTADRWFMPHMDGILDVLLLVGNVQIAQWQFLTTTGCNFLMCAHPPGR